MFDLKTVYKRFKEETPYDDSAINRRCESIDNLHPNLHPIVLSWLNGKHDDYDFRGITLKEIMKKENCTYIDAVYSMSTFLQFPELVDGYSDYEHHYDIVGRLPSAEE